MKFNKKHLFFLIPIGILEIVMLVLECLPRGVEMQFVFPDAATGDFITNLQYYPYFSDMPYGYGNVFPVYIGILTLAIMILWIANLFADKKGINVAIFVMTIVKFIFSAVELIFSRTAINWATFAISLVLAIYCVAKAIVNKEFSRSKAENADTAEELEQN